MSFTWSTNASVLALFGGFLVGGVAIVRLFTLGKVTGISGIFGGLLMNDSKHDREDKLYRFAFVASLIAGGYACTKVFPDCFEGIELKLLCVFQPKSSQP